MTVYEHTQPGTLIRWIMGIVIVGLTVLMAAVKVWSHPIYIQLIPVASVAMLIICLALFHSLTVEIDETNMTVRFGPGPIRKVFLLNEIRSARVVRNKWWYGWGIRLTPHGWLYNVSGLDAVELELKDEKKFRVGTDRPEELLAAIQSATGRTG